MRQFTEDTLTEAVIARLKESKDPRFTRVMESAVRHLHAFAREVELTEEEWFEGIKFLTAVGQKCDAKRQEFILLSDILGLSMMVVALNHKTAPGATEATVIGPFFARGAREFEYGADLRTGATVKGEDCWVGGRVLSVDGRKVKHVTMDNLVNRVNSSYQYELISDEEKLNIDRVVGQEERTYFSYRVGTIAGVFRTRAPEFSDVPDKDINWPLLNELRNYRSAPGGGSEPSKR